jgi:AcrR family transcriptional regulator
MRRAVRTPRRPRRQDYERTRRRILQAARGLIAEWGPEGLSVSAVARAAEINRTTAYQHFRTRDDLVRAVTDELFREVAARIAEPRPLAERIEYLVGYFLEHPEIARLALHLVLSEDPFPRAVWTAAIAEAKEILANEGGHPDVDAEMLLHVLMAVGILWPLHARAEFGNARAARAARERLTRELKRLLLYGIFRPEASPGLVAALARPTPEKPDPPRRTT